MLVGEIITVTTFAFTNKAGGTGLSNWKWDEKFEKPIKVKVIKSFHDYETGQRMWAVPVPEETELLAYLDRNAKKGLPIVQHEPDFNITYDDSDYYVLFVGQFDIQEKQ